MEAYKTTCADCRHVRVWKGFKTGIGKSATQLAQMEKDRTTCQKCGSKNVTTDLDHDAEDGQMLDEQCALVWRSILS